PCVFKIAATAWMLAGVSSTTRTRSFMAKTPMSEATRLGCLLQQGLSVAKGVALDVLIERRQVVAGEDRAERIAVSLEKISRARIELIEQLPHLGDQRREGRGLDRRSRWRSSRGRRQRLGGQRGTQSIDQASQLVGDPLSKLLGVSGIAAAGNGLLELRRRGLHVASAEVARHRLERVGEALGFGVVPGRQTLRDAVWRRRLLLDELAQQLLVERSVSREPSEAIGHVESFDRRKSRRRCRERFLGRATGRRGFVTAPAAEARRARVSAERARRRGLGPREPAP